MQILVKNIYFYFYFYFFIFIFYFFFFFIIIFVLNNVIGIGLSHLILLTESKEVYALGNNENYVLGSSDTSLKLNTLDLKYLSKDKPPIKGYSPSIFFFEKNILFLNFFLIFFLFYWKVVAGEKNSAVLFSNGRVMRLIFCFIILKLFSITISK